jgi:hypothetical protein
MGSENRDGFTERGDERIGSHKGRHTKEKMKRHPARDCRSPAGTLNLLWSGERYESEALTSLICAFIPLKCSICRFDFGNPQRPSRHV